VAGWTLLVLLIVGTTWVTAKPARPTFRVTAQTEVVEILARPGRLTSLLVLPGALYWERSTYTQLGDVSVEVGDSVRVRLRRLSPDTLDVTLESLLPGKGAGVVTQGEETIRTLGDSAWFRVPVPQHELLFSFRAVSVKVGSAIGFEVDQRKPVLRSGQVRLSDRTLFGTEFQGGSRELRTGDVLDVPGPGHAPTRFGSAIVLVDGHEAMTLSLTMQAPQARVSFDAFENDGAQDERLTTRLLDRLRNDPVLAFGWILVLFLVLHPIGSVLADGVKTRAESLINPS
jgi:hypothetical protein